MGGSNDAERRCLWQRICTRVTFLTLFSYFTLSWFRLHHILLYSSCSRQFFRNTFIASRREHSPHTIIKSTQSH